MGTKRKYTNVNFASCFPHVTALKALADGSAHAGAAGGADGDELAFQVGPYGFEAHTLGTLTDFGLEKSATGLIVSDDAADNEGYEITQGITAASPMAFTVGTDPAFFFRVKLNIDVTGKFDVVHVGFRNVQAYAKPTLTPAGYEALYSGATDNKTSIGVHATDGSLYTVKTQDGTDAAVDTTQAITFGTALDMKVLVSSSGAVTFQHDGATAGTLAAPTATQAADLDTDDVVVPYLIIIRGAATGGVLELREWECGYQ